MTFLKGRSVRTADPERGDTAGKRAARPRLRGFTTLGSLGVLGWAAVVHGCGGSEFCAADSYECGTPAAGSGGSAGTAGTSGSGSGGKAGTGGKAGSGGGGGGKGGTAGNAGGGTGGDAGASGGGAESGAGGAGGEGGKGDPPPPICDPSAPIAGCVADPENGIFVSPTGNDSNDGTPSSPLATINAAIDRAASRPAPIFICSGTFDESVVVTDDDLALHGGFACPTGGAPWVYDEDERPLISPTDPGYALQVTDVNGLTLSDLELRSAHATAAGASSIAVFVSGSDAVTLTRVHITAGDGANGASAMAPVSNHTTADQTGKDAVLTEGGEATPCACGDATASIGASGGDGGLSPTAGGAGTPDQGGGQPGAVGSCATVGTGHDGGSAPNESDADGANLLGTLGTSGWTPAAGASGLTGEPGQGGGGGAAVTAGGGGGGACGGCGGTGGGAGKGGGASIGLVAVMSNVTLVASFITTGDAGRGGDGIAGELGQGGGVKGNGVGSACDGGNGGKGGNGGAGGGGAGGISVGVLHTGDSTVTADVTFELGMAGPAGTGGGANNNGIAGVAENELQG